MFIDIFLREWLFPYICKAKRMARMRKVIHIDMDAFYASVEQRDRPELRGRPIAVGHSGRRGVVAAASYEARRYGVRSAMPSSKAARLCPSLVWVEPRFDVYKNVSRQIHGIFHDYTDIIEPISLDEAFLDVTDNKKGMEMAVEIAREIKARIREELHLVASAGVSCNKFLAKIASDYRKPDGLFTIHPSRAMAFVETLPVEDFWGVGPVTARKMHALGIRTGLDLRQWTVEALQREFGKVGKIYYDFARGLDERPVETYRRRVSVGCETTLDDDVSDREQLHVIIADLTQDLLRRVQRSSFSGRTLTLKVKHSDFTQHTRSRTDTTPWDADKIRATAAELLEGIDYRQCPLRLLGLTLSNPTESDPLDRPSDWPQLHFDFDTERDMDLN